MIYEMVSFFPGKKEIKCQNKVPETQQEEKSAQKQVGQSEKSRDMVQQGERKRSFPRENNSGPRLESKTVRTTDNRR